MDGQNITIEEVPDEEINRGMEFFKKMAKMDYAGGFKAGDVFMVSCKGKLWQLTKKQVLDEWLVREDKRRKQKIKDRLKSMNFDENDDK